MPEDKHEEPGVVHAKSSRDAQDAFRAIVPDDARVTTRPMFGSVAAFANDHMFMCLFADELYFRLAEEDRQELSDNGGKALEPMPGRPMREYVGLPEWQSRMQPAREWSERALAYAMSLGPKKK
ncbi:MAG TPA: TfoX/Sxy family protein [Candidatus Limnocylindria bacterium]|nr:TfoX/Sxy family protein [Candidatus Limnocylindria bacterium]